ncbi:MATE family efflux transporter [Halogeometricum borinquense]|uniref:efflux protein, MATE family n=2 Tax=Halogeometricum borinquense TaxID=60847 RepID=E4NNJ5_HALBP|nr:MATE family efflux transporter [Halogeometricum borinquense]ADQ66349.1 putative efflux protein, MATE family [Halogeometricum borinquense DSM 11551]ELY27661.1 efflux protein, mate family [Halogeometricum borinquense DSM 11551]QIB75451.1 MATE family efflux transporter [Halogeometricum borinquense]QIQ75718.1 MATE family efflux transporter [Halogeometricum borinquense]RYJ14640.1 MATE family efflux transporter [Halogeometricum borinquense]
MSARDVNLTDGDLLKPLLVLSLPIILSQMMQVCYNLADTFWVGRVGENAVSALSFSWPIVFLMISIGGGFTVAGTVLVAQNKGAGNDDRVNHVAGQTIAFVILLSAIFSALGYIFAPSLLNLIGTTPGTEVHALSVSYTRTIFLGVYFMFGFFIFQALLRGWGDTRTPMYLMAFGVVLNVIIDPFLILGFQNNPIFGMLGFDGLQATLFSLTGFTGMGVQGAAVATVFSRGVGALVGFYLLFSGRVGIHLSKDDLILKADTVRSIVRIGAPTSIEQSTRALGVTALTALAAYAGTTVAGIDTSAAVAAFGIGNRLNSLVFLPAIGLQQGVETVVGQNLGADKPERSKQTVFLGVGLISAALAVVSVVSYQFAEPIVAVFIPGEPNVIAIGVNFLRINALGFVFLGIFRVVSGGFRGSGSTRTAMAFSLLALWVLRIPPAYALVEWTGLGLDGIWYAMAFSNVAAAIVAGLWFLRGTWTDNVVDVSRPVPADD